VQCEHVRSCTFFRYLLTLNIVVSSELHILIAGMPRQNAYNATKLMAGLVQLTRSQRSQSKTSEHTHIVQCCLRAPLAHHITASWNMHGAARDMPCMCKKRIKCCCSARYPNSCRSPFAYRQHKNIQMFTRLSRAIKVWQGDKIRLRLTQYPF